MSTKKSDDSKQNPNLKETHHIDNDTKKSKKEQVMAKINDNSNRKDANEEKDNSQITNKDSVTDNRESHKKEEKSDSKYNKAKTENQDSTEGRA